MRRVCVCVVRTPTGHAAMRSQPFSMTTDRLCGGDLDRKLAFEVYDWDQGGGHDLIGRCYVSLPARDAHDGRCRPCERATDGGRLTRSARVSASGALRLRCGAGRVGQVSLRALQNKRNVKIPLVNPKKEGKRGYQNSGELIFTAVDTAPKYTLLEYLSGGCEVNLVVAIDYTASNGNPAYPTSLHYINPYEPNEYMKAIQAVGTVLSAYDADRQLPVRQTERRASALTPCP